MFTQSMKDAKVLKIERIQNKSIWKPYRDELENLTDKYNGEKPEEVYLFHKTN